MEIFLWGWVAGMAALAFWSVLPAAWPVLAVLAGGLLLIALGRRAGLSMLRRHGPPAGLLIVAAALAVLVSTQAARAQLTAWLPASCEGRSLSVRGIIVGLPEPADPTGVRFRFRPEAEVMPCIGRASQWQLSTRLPLSVRPGEVWQLGVRLKRPHTTFNPGGFDAERWWHQERVTATGWVSHGRRLAAAGKSVDDLRWRIRERLLAAFPEQPEAAGTVLALLTGDRVGLSVEAWERYARTGITHLVAISGVHITMLAWLAGWMARRLWLCLPGAALRQPASRVAALCGWLAAAGYGVLAGLELPTQRTLLMLAVIVLIRWLPGEYSGRQILLAALAVVLLCDPLAIHAVGLWLSFAAVALLMAAGMPLGEEGGWRSALRAQWIATWGLLPLSLAIFARISWVSLPVNLVAIPWVTFAVVPLAMLGLLLQPLSPAAGDLAWAAAVWLMATLDAGLAVVSAWPGAASHFALPGFTPLWLGLALALLLMPRALPGRALAILPLLVLAWPQPGLRYGQMRLTVLDVGQGLALHVATAGHDLLFDTGPPAGPQADAGGRVILPYLRWQGVRSLDLLVFSHDHLDHTGGGASVLRGIPVRRVLGEWPSLLSAWPQSQRPQQQPCRAGQSWQWDGVRFSLLWPSPPLEMRKENDRSCVLRIEVAGQVVLIPGDLEHRGELALQLLTAPEQLRADLLVLGHHGSKTSTTAGFLAAVRPREVIAAVGYRNPFRHPARVVMQRLHTAGVPGWRTDLTGALRYEFLQSGQLPSVRRWRLEQPHYWSLPLPAADGPHAGGRAALGALAAFP